MLNYYRSDVFTFCLSGVLVGRNPLLRVSRQELDPGTSPGRRDVRLSGMLIGRNLFLSALIPAPYDSLV